jgi:hypothetical protein
MYFLQNCCAVDFSQLADLALGSWPRILIGSSPDPNPIEMAFGTLEALLRNIAAGTIRIAWCATSGNCNLYMTWLSHNLFCHSCVGFK